METLSLGPSSGALPRVEEGSDGWVMGALWREAGKPVVKVRTEPSLEVVRVGVGGVGSSARPSRWIRKRGRTLRRV